MVAGEESGDILGAGLLREIRKEFDCVDAIGIGGRRMVAEGFASWHDMERLSVRGYVEVLKRLPELLILRAKMKKRILDYLPDIFIGIDAPDFNLEIERFLKGKGIITIHYVSPSIWAWRSDRLKTIKKSVDKMLTLFPFENSYYESFNIPVSFVGHPLADTLYPEDNVEELRKKLGMEENDNPVISLLPGSRRSEVEQMTQVLLRTALLITEKFPNATFLVPVVNKEIWQYVSKMLDLMRISDIKVKVMLRQATDAMRVSNVGIITSGTATLEPMIITYRMPKISQWIMQSRSTNLPYVGLPNILCNEFISPEILLNDATPEKLSRHAISLLLDKNRQVRVKNKFQVIREMLRRDASKEAFKAIVSSLRQN